MAFFGIIGTLLGIILFGFIVNAVEDYNKQSNRVNMSFKEAMDLANLPVVTFYNNNKKINFLLDTGSNQSQINKSVLASLDYKMLDEKSQVTGIEGFYRDVEYCTMKILYKNQEFNNEFCVCELQDAFDLVKKETGVTIHGILGSQFFQKYKYILDFESLIAYSNK